MTKKKLFTKIGFAIAGTFVPGIPAVEAGIEALTSGKDKREAVMGIAAGAVQAIEFAASEDLVNDADFKKGLRMVNDGYVLIHKAVNRHGKEGKDD